MLLQAMGAFLAFSGAAGSGVMCLAAASIAALTYAFIGIVVVAGDAGLHESPSVDFEHC